MANDAAKKFCACLTKQRRKNYLDLALTYLAMACPSWQDDVESSSLSTFVSFVEGCVAAWLRSLPVLFGFATDLYIRRACTHEIATRRSVVGIAVNARGGDATRIYDFARFHDSRRETRTTTTKSTRGRCYSAERVVRSNFDTTHA